MAESAAKKATPVVITAGGRTTLGDHMVKALVTLGGVAFLERVLTVLQSAPSVGAITVVGPSEIEPLTTQYGVTLLPEGKTGIENLQIGLEYAKKEAGTGHVLFVASDMPFLTVDAIETLLIETLLNVSLSDADIIFPVTTKADFDKKFPHCPGTWTKLREGEVTGGSVFLLRPSAIARNLGLLEKTFAVRKSQIGMARLLGLPFIIAFLTHHLTIPAAERRVSQITGCNCKAYLNAPPELSCDIDTPEEYLWAEQHITNPALDTMVEVPYA
jgi:GTP:adenosylcobinamide-phosphate guanylyltransferase